MKIAFVGDTGMEAGVDNGFGRVTMNMIQREEVDLVVDVGDFDYWGRCTEEYQVRESFNVSDAESINRTIVTNSTLRRFKWQNGRYGSRRGWEIGIKKDYSLDAKNSLKEERFLISTGKWRQLETAHLDMLRGERDCRGAPWDGPWEWRQFVRSYRFDFLAASGNAEVKDAPIYGSPEIWAAHQQHMWEVYRERIASRRRGQCRGFHNQTDSVEEYGERYSCFYGDHHIIFLGWWQGSNERLNGAKERTDSVEFIHREFGSTEPRVQNSRWRYCVHHMTSAKLSAGGGPSRDSMVLSGITDACRQHGALIFNGHHHMYSRTKMLTSVGGTNENPEVTDSADVIKEGRTMSITVGMGGYDGACDGKYVNAAWMQSCIASRQNHRGAVIAEFDDETPWKATFRYKNSIANATIEDEFTLISRLPGWDIGNTWAPTMAPSRREATHSPSNVPVVSPSEAPQKPSSAAPLVTPTQSPIVSPSDTPVQTSNAFEPASSWASRCFLGAWHFMLSIFLV